MKKFISMFSMLLSLGATAAHAEHKLLITDVLDAGQFEAQGTASYQRTSFDFKAVTINGVRFNTNVKQERYDSSVSLGVGLASGLQLSASVPYMFSRTAQQPVSSDAGAQSSGAKGFGDVVIGSRYRLFGDAKKLTTVVVGLDVKLDTAEERVVWTSSFDYRPYVTLSTVIDETVRPYGFYQATVKNQPNGELHVLGVGAELAMNKQLTLRPEFSVGLFTDSREFIQHETYNLGLSAYLQLQGNLYLVPALNVVYKSKIDARLTREQYSDITKYGVALGVYYLFP